MQIKLTAENQKSLAEFRKTSELPVGSITELANHYIRLGMVTSQRALQACQQHHQERKQRMRKGAKAISKLLSKEKPYTAEQLMAAGQKKYPFNAGETVRGF